jgi:hypothetical protein
VRGCRAASSSSSSLLACFHGGVSPPLSNQAAYVPADVVSGARRSKLGDACPPRRLAAVGLHMLCAVDAWHATACSHRSCWAGRGCCSLCVHWGCCRVCLPMAHCVAGGIVCGSGGVQATGKVVRVCQGVGSRVLSRQQCVRTGMYSQL